MTVYYRDSTISVRSSQLQIDQDIYDLDTLSYVWHRTRRSGGGHLRTKLLTGTILGILVVALTLIALLKLDFGQYRWHVLTAAMVAGIGLIAAAGFGVDPLLDLLDQGHDHGSGTHEIWARTGGREILLFSTSDSLRFGKVYRALQRALERHHSSR